MINKNASKLLLIMAVLSCIVTTETAYGTENFAGDFLQLGSGARLLGMGSASVATSNDASSSYYNPARLALINGREANLMHSEQFGGLENYNSIAVASPLSNDTYIGVTLLHLGVGDIKYTRIMDPSRAPSDSNRVEIASREDAADYALYISGARKITNKIGIGSSIKVIRRSVGSDTAFGYGIDIGMYFNATDHWSAGLNLRDATGTTIAWDGHANDRIAATLDAGMAYSDEMPLFGGYYIVTASMLFFGDSPDLKGIETMNLGCEYMVYDFLAIRAGSSQGDTTFGMGLLKLPLISSTALDYAFLSHEEFDSTHRISLTVHF